MAAPKVYPKTCEHCKGYYRGNKTAKYCDPCRAEINRTRIRGNELDPSKLMVRICEDCKCEYMGTRQGRVCASCAAARIRETNRARSVEFRERQKMRAALGAPPKIPPPCQRCHYCHETDAYPSGMACLAEAFMRCQPWSLGAKPLKEREQ